jgi:two-component system OmpR family response regulator
MFPTSDTRGPKVLVVDDDAALRELMVTRLTIAGYEAYEARDGQEAMERLFDIKPAAMVLDINMPRMDGFTVLETLAGRGGIKNLRIMVLTARNQSGDVRRAIALGAHDYLAKPFKDMQFLVRMARLVRK